MDIRDYVTSTSIVSTDLDRFRHIKLRYKDEIYRVESLWCQMITSALYHTLTNFTTDIANSEYLFWNIGNEVKSALKSTYLDYCIGV